MILNHLSFPTSDENLSDNTALSGVPLSLMDYCFLHLYECINEISQFFKLPSIVLCVTNNKKHTMILWQTFPCIENGDLTMWFMLSLMLQEISASHIDKWGQWLKLCRFPCFRQWIVLAIARKAVFIQSVCFLVKNVKIFNKSIFEKAMTLNISYVVIESDVL